MNDNDEVMDNAFKQFFVLAHQHDLFERIDSLPQRLLVCQCEQTNLRIAGLLGSDCLTVTFSSDSHKIVYLVRVDNKEKFELQSLVETDVMTGVRMIEEVINRIESSVEEVGRLESAVTTRRERMKILENKLVSLSWITLCKHCGSLLEVAFKDIYLYKTYVTYAYGPDDYQDFEYVAFTCPICRTRNKFEEGKKYSRDIPIQYRQ